MIGPSTFPMLTTLLVGLAVAPVLSEDILLYPDAPDFPLTGSVGHLNPRFPAIPPQKGGSRGRCFPVQLIRFDYSLRPYVRFPEGGRLSAAARDNLHPTGQLFFCLSDATHSLKLIREDLGKDLQVRFVYAKGKEELDSVDLTPFTSAWSEVQLAWNQSRASLHRGGERIAEVKLSAAFDPTKLDLTGWAVDELQLVGDGQFTLDWEAGYAARINLSATPDARLVSRVFGFDAHVVGLDQANRDRPMVQLIETGSKDRAVTLSFDLKSEVSEQRHEWQQQVSVPARSALMIPIRFPFEMQTDIYHMAIRSAETDPRLDTNKHFMYVKLRGEPAGPEKFGLHDSGRTTGSWPDALPIHLDHNYVTWHMTQGPSYVRWWNGNWGIDPDLPPEQWYWRTKIDQAFYAGRTVLACVSVTPSMPWMRAREYEEGIARRKLGPDYVGGAPDVKRYRRYLRALANRYKGKIDIYEVENEPNAVGWNYRKPEDYVETCKAVYEEMKAVDPDVPIFGISGTGEFIGYMREVFKLGGHEYMDGVSWHTYVHSGMPHEIDLIGKLAAVREVMAQTGKKLPIINTETGLKFANRRYIDRPVSEAELRQLKRTGGDTYPQHGMTEHKGGAAYVQNAVVNFLAGAEYFTIFGWNPKWSDPNATPGDVEYGWFVGAHEAGRRTPGRHTLALGVFTAQMEPAIHTRGRTVNQDGIQGGVFPKTNGGELAVLWSTGKPRTMFIRSQDRELEHVTMLGQANTLAGQEDKGAYIHTVVVKEEPSYVHARKPLESFVPSPMKSVTVDLPPAHEDGRIQLVLENVFPEPWEGQIALAEDARWQIAPVARRFTIGPGQQVTLMFKYRPGPNVPNGRYSQALEITLPNATPYLSAFTIPIRPIFRIPRLPDDSSAAGLRAWQPPGGPLLLDRRDQVVVGRPSDLASLQEANAWAGTEELSAEAKIGYNDEGLFVYIRVHDRDPRLPEGWPSVLGSSVEFFFDLRPEDKGLGTVSYDDAVHQVVVRPVIRGGQEPGVWHASPSSAALPNLSVEAGVLDEKNYWVTLHIAWRDIGRAFRPGTRIGFDVGVNGPYPGEGGRKSQIMMFGTSDNCVNASQFGVGVLDGRAGQGDP